MTCRYQTNQRNNSAKKYVESFDYVLLVRINEKKMFVVVVLSDRLKNQKKHFAISK